MVLTGNDDRNIAIEAVNKGHIFWFLTKPLSSRTVAFRNPVGPQAILLVVAERELLEKTLSGSVKMLTEILAVVDQDAFGRGQRSGIRQHDILGSFWGLKWILGAEVAALLSQVGWQPCRAA